MLVDADYLVGVRVTIVTNGWRLWVTWLRIDHNGVGVYTLYLPLNLEIKIASYLSSFLYYILIYNLSLYTTTTKLITSMNPVFILLC